MVPFRDEMYNEESFSVVIKDVTIHSSDDAIHIYRILRYFTDFIDLNKKLLTTQTTRGRTIASKTIVCINVYVPI